MAPHKVEDTQSCRACLEKPNSTESNSMHYIHDIIKVSQIEISLAQAISLCTAIEITMDDLMPQYLCNVCKNTVCNSYEFRILCERSDTFLKAELSKNGTNNLNNCNIVKSQKSSSEQNNKTIFEELHSEYKCEEILINQHKTCEKTETYLNQDETKVMKNQKVIESIEENRSDYVQPYNSKHYRENNETKTKKIVSLEHRTCDQCGKVFQKKSNMLIHKRKHEASTKTCRFCDYIPATPAKLAQHMDKEHKNLKNVSCRECGKTFFKKANLRLHLLVHTGIKRYTCEVCGISFALAGNLNTHKRLHTGEKPYTCSHCGKGFTQYSTLRSHEVCHTTKKEHICSECGAEFSRRGALRNHKQRHQRSRPFVCSLCKKAFPFRSELKRHMITHTGVQNHVCDVCDKRFNRNSNLRVHMRIHTGETPHICHVCGKGFIQAHCLRTHLNTHK